VSVVATEALAFHIGFVGRPGIPGGSVACDPKGLDYLKLEIRQDIVATPAGRASVAAMIDRPMLEALT
jgi:hypothetical protein